MSTAWRVQSARDELGILRVSPHQFEQTCACFSGIRITGQVITVAAFGGSTASEGSALLREGRAARNPGSSEVLESPVVSDVAISV